MRTRTCRHVPGCEPLENAFCDEQDFPRVGRCVLYPRAESGFGRHRWQHREELGFSGQPGMDIRSGRSSNMVYKDARVELIRCAKACDRRLRDLDCWHSNMQQMALESVVEERQKEIRSQLKEFPSWPIVDAWLKEVQRPGQSRKRVLALAGPSRTGTEFVRKLFPPWGSARTQLRWRSVRVFAWVRCTRASLLVVG